MSTYHCPNCNAPVTVKQDLLSFAPPAVSFPVEMFGGWGLIAETHLALRERRTYRAPIGDWVYRIEVFPDQQEIRFTRLNH